MAQGILLSCGTFRSPQVIDPCGSGGDARERAGAERAAGADGAEAVPVRDGHTSKILLAV